MGLNKRVCEKCWATNIPPHTNWSHLFNKWWDENQIKCPWKIISKLGVINSYNMLYSPPDHCPNGLEHIIANRQEEINEKEFEDVKQRSL